MCIDTLKRNGTSTNLIVQLLSVCHTEICTLTDACITKMFVHIRSYLLHLACYPQMVSQNLL